MQFVLPLFVMLEIDWVYSTSLCGAPRNKHSKVVPGWGLNISKHQVLAK